MSRLLTSNQARIRCRVGNDAGVGCLCGGVGGGVLTPAPPPAAAAMRPSDA
jgi:hypothetical protein